MILFDDVLGLAVAVALSHQPIEATAEFVPNTTVGQQYESFLGPAITPTKPNPKVVGGPVQTTHIGPNPKIPSFQQPFIPPQRSFVETK